MKKTETISSFGDAEMEMSNKKPVFGIDLGTTNSAISVVASNAAKPIKLKTGKFTMPSCIIWLGDHFAVGEEAYARRDQDNVCYSVKRLMQDTSAVVELKYEGKSIQLTPAEVSAKILSALIEQTGGFYGKIEDVVVTVPAYFDQNGVTETRKACELAGLNLITISNEPTAASLCYDLADGTEQKDIVVFDLGGGTFDVTLARISDGSSSDELSSLYGIESKNTIGSDAKIVSVLDIDGDTKLGGDDIDQQMLEILYSKLVAVGIKTEFFTPQYKEKLLLRVEQMKKVSVEEIREFGISTVDLKGNLIETSVMIYAEDFKKACKPIYMRTKKIVERLLQRNKHAADVFVLVGGSTKNKWIQKFLQEDFVNYKINNAFDPDLSVTCGASIHGNLTKFGSGDIQVFEVLPITVGILENDKVKPMILAGTSLPTEIKAPFTTVTDNQTSLQIKLLQGQSTYEEECVNLGTLDITGIKKRPAGEAQLLVTITISADRLMKCVANIDGIQKELRLNLSGETKRKSLDRNEKLIIRWRKQAARFSGSIQAALNTMIDEFPTHHNKEDIMAFIVKHREQYVDTKEVRVNEFDES